MKNYFFVMYGVAFVALTKGYWMMVDWFDLPIIALFRWCVATSLGKVYVTTSVPGAKPRKQVYLHRLLLGITDGKVKVDHSDGSGLNNKRSNLRRATHAENMHNQKLNIKSTTGFKGVSPAKEAGQFQSYIHVNGKMIYLGCRPTAEQAAALYDAAAIKYHGAFARTNQMLQAA